MKRISAALSLASVVVAMTAPAASAGAPLADTTVVEKVKGMFRVYVNEGDEDGVGCLV